MFNLTTLLILQFSIILLIILLSFFFRKNFIKIVIFIPLVFNLFLFLIEDRQVEFLFLNLSFFIVFLEFYSLITRGFSISLVLTLKNNFSINTKNKLLNNYADKGIDWLTQNRIDGLININFLRKKNDYYYINNSFFFILFKILIVVKKIFNLQKIK